jgi:SAM-dependent methyltransferase
VKFTSGRPETLCGAGSTLAETEYLRGALPGILCKLGVRRLLDAPCGDFNWMSQVNLYGIQYIGCDASMENIQSAYRRADLDFREMDIVTDDLPPADAMLCRDFYQHLPHRMVFSALRNFVSSGIPWLLATTHDNAVNDDIPKASMFRRLNLGIAPFNFPQPSILIPDPPNSGHYLGVWNREEVMQAIC